MTPCPDETTLSRYHDQELAAADLTAIKDHLSACETCRDRLQALQQLDQLILASLSASDVTSQTQRRRPFRRLLAAASLFLVIGGLAIAALGGRLTKSLAPNSSAISQQEYLAVSPSGATYQVKTRGEVLMLSLEVNGAATQLETEERR